MLTLLLSMFIFGSVGVVRRLIPLPSSVLACFRGACGALLLFVVAKAQRKKLRSGIGIHKTLLLLLSGALIGFNWILLFEAYRFTTVATATLCYYMAPTIVVALSPLMFRERITLRKGLCALVSVLGMVFVSGILEGGALSLADLRGVLLALGAAALYAAVVILNKKLPGIDAYAKTILQLLSAAVALVPYLLITRPAIEIALTPGIVALLLLIGFVHTGAAYALYFGSIDHLSAQTVAIFSYLDPITALVLSALVLHEPMTVLGLVGAVLIIGAAILGELSPPSEG